MNWLSLDYLCSNNKLVVLASLLKQPWAMLLDSGGVSSQNAYNRYDIFTYQPSVKLTFSKKTTQIESAQDFSSLNLDLSQPLDCMRQLLTHFQTDSSNTKQSINLPFNGGWLGYISYDFGRHIEKLPNTIDDDLHLPQIQMGLYQWALITDHQEKWTRLFNFGLNSNDWQQLVNTFNQLPKNQNISECFSLTNDWQSNMSQENYASAFNQVRDYIYAGDCYQVNLAQRFQADFIGSPLDAYASLTQQNQAPFSAYLNFEQHQILSISPERFIESHNNEIKTQPIKGTRPRKLDPTADEQQANELINSEKDRAENLMIVDLLRNDLSRTAAKGSVKVTELFGHYRFSSVHHLISTIESKLAKGYDNFDLLATTLPGGSITGAPKIRAMQIIEELEPVRRGIYCGIIGYVDFNGNMDSNITIRTLVTKNHKIYAWAGGGLVADSEQSLEYQETFDKLSKILPVLSNHPSSKHHD